MSCFIRYSAFAILRALPISASPCRRVAASVLLLLSFLTSAHAEYVWVEGENPTTSTMTRHPWYDSVHKDKLSGGALISNYSDTKIGEAHYEFQASKAATYDLWVRANPVQSSLSYQLDSGAWTPIVTDKDALDVTNIAADDKPDLRFLAWMKAGPVKLAVGKHAIAFRMDSKLSHHGYLDCFLFTTEPFQPAGALKPDQIAQRDRAAAAQNQGWVPFNPPIDPFNPDAALDLRSLNEPVAGAHGFIEARGNHFVYPDTGQVVRFWAVNGAGANEPAAVRQSARMLAKHGVNLVRLHGGIFDAAGNADPVRIQEAIGKVEELKAEGIYSHFSIYFPLWLTPQPNTPWLPGYDGKTHPFAALYFNPDFQKQYQSWWKALLTTPSARTGRKLIDEPAVCSAEIINEDSYFFWTFNDKIPDAELRILESQFAAWLKAKYGTLDKTFTAWNNLKVSRDNPAENRIGFRGLWNIAHDRTRRDQDTTAFLLESQTAFYADTVKFLRGLGFKGLITASNWYTADARLFGPLERLSYTPGSFIDRHGYFGCRQRGENADWSVRVGHTWVDRSALRFDPEEPGQPRSFANPIEDICYNDKPSMISETTFNRPNRYRSEAPLFFAAYGALQDTGAIVHFALDTARWQVKPGFFMQPWTLMSPAMMGQFPAAALIYRQSLLAPGDVLVDLNLTTADLLQLKGSPLTEDANLDELRRRDQPPGTPAAAPAAIDPLVHFAGRTRIHFVGEPKPSTLKDLAPFIDRAAEKVTSTTGQIVLDYKRGILTLRAPAAQGLSGNLQAAGETALPDLIINSPLELGHIIAVSLDGKPLATSARILLQVMSEEKPSHFASEPAPNPKDGCRITDIGQDPWLFRELAGTVRFKRADAASLKVTALDANGYPARQLGPATRITLEAGTLYYLITR